MTTPVDRVDDVEFLLALASCWTRLPTDPVGMRTAPVPDLPRSLLLQFSTSQVALADELTHLFLLTASTVQFRDGLARGADGPLPRPRQES